jgi:hypothetical protein
MKSFLFVAGNFSISNVEYRIMNVEVRHSTRREPLGRTIIFIHSKRQSEAIPYFDIRYSLFDIYFIIGYSAAVAHFQFNMFI